MQSISATLVVRDDSAIRNPALIHFQLYVWCLNKQSRTYKGCLCHAACTIEGGQARLNILVTCSLMGRGKRHKSGKWKKDRH